MFVSSHHRSNTIFYVFRHQVIVKSFRGNREIVGIRETVPGVFVKLSSNRETVGNREIVSISPIFPRLAHGGFQLNTEAVHRCWLTACL